MNIRSLTRGDGVVIGAALLLIIASFLNYYAIDCPSGVSDAQCDEVNKEAPSGWSSDAFPVLPAVFLAGLIGAALIVVGRMQPERRPGGFTLDQVGTGLAGAALLSSLFSLFGSPMGSDEIGASTGAYIAFLGVLLLAAGAVLGTAVPVFKAPLLPAPKTPGPAGPYGGQPQAGYGYPGGPQPGPGQPYGAQQPAPYGAGQPGPGGPQAGPRPQAAGQPGGGAPFAPFWFAVPATRPLFAEDGSSAQVGELSPGIWYLAVDQRGPALVAQTQDGRRGVLQDTTGIQRGA